MRFAWLWLVGVVRIGAACDDTSPRPPGCAACGDPPPRPADCEVLCTADNSDCATFPYDRLPARCAEICYVGACCELVGSAWQRGTVDCARPGEDAGLDAAGDGMP